VSSADPAATARAVGVVPVIALPTPDAAIPLCEALLRGGLGVVEITFRTEGAAAAIAMISEQLPEMCVGAGTVLDPEEARQAKAAGARFAVSPGTNPGVLWAAREVSLPFWPGVCTPSDIERALSLGHRLLKYFPAGALGGASTVNAILAPYRHLGVEVIPTGGIDEDSAPSYWRLPEVAAVGGTWIASYELIAAGNWPEIAGRAKAAAERFRATREG
jgi:2-dehydro-3-deoxyphosphogluconate aldolase/(4S)-4-hydroxy-2-oxoglutarate aldolase